MKAISKANRKQLLFVSVSFIVSSMTNAMDKTPVIVENYFSNPHQQLFTGQISDQGDITHQSRYLVKHSLAEGAENFLADLQEILDELSDLESQMKLFIPGHSLNPQTLTTSLFQRRDWRTKLPAFGVDPVFESAREGRIQQLNQALKSSQKISKSFQEEADDINKRHDAQEERTRKTKQFPHNSNDTPLIKTPEVQPPTEDDLKSVSDSLVQWFIGRCSSSITHRLDTLYEWLASLPRQELRSDDVKHLQSMLQNDVTSPKILEMLNRYLKVYIASKLQWTFAQLQPLYLDLKTSLSTLKLLHEEVRRESTETTNILNNKKLFLGLDTLLRSSIKGRINEYLQSLQQHLYNTDTQAKPALSFLSLNFQQMMEDAYEECPVTFLKSEPKETLEKDASPVSDLQAFYHKVIASALETALQQKTHLLPDDIFEVNVAPIMQYIYNKMYPHFSKVWGPKAPQPKEIIQVPIGKDLQDLWRIPQDGFPRAKQVVSEEIGEQKMPKLEFEPVEVEETPPVHDRKAWQAFIEKSRQKYLKAQSPINVLDGEVALNRVRFLKEIKQRKHRPNVLSKSPSLESFHVALCRSNDESSFQFFTTVKEVIDTYVKDITVLQVSLSEALKGYQSQYRMDLDFLQHPEKMVKRLMVSFSDIKEGRSLSKNWQVIKQTIGDSPEALEKIKDPETFTKEVSHLVLVLLKLEDLLSDLGTAQDITSRLDIEQVFTQCERLNSFSLQFQPFRGLESQSIQTLKFRNWLLVQNLPIVETVKRLLNLSEQSEQPQDTKSDWVKFIGFIKEYYEETLQDCFRHISGTRILTTLKDHFKPESSQVIETVLLEATETGKEELEPDDLDKEATLKSKDINLVISEFELTEPNQSEQAQSPKTITHELSTPVGNGGSGSSKDHTDVSSTLIEDGETGSSKDPTKVVSTIVEDDETGIIETSQLQETSLEVHPEQQ